MTALPNIPEFYNADDMYKLFDQNEFVFERMHISTFKARKNLNVDQPIALAMELPQGAFIAGGFMKSIIQGETPKDYDIYFTGPQPLWNLVRRIHNAPEGSFLHGYESDSSMKSFADSQMDMYINFTHPTKPTLQLIRIRWFERQEDCIDKFDFCHCMFALGSDLTLVYEPRAHEDARRKTLRLMSTVFELSTSLRMKRYLEAGWLWISSRYDNYSRDDMLRKAQRYLQNQSAIAKGEGKAVPQNVGDYGEFLAYE